jgi:hypothetical protein
MIMIPPPEEPKLPYLWNKFIPVLKEFDAELDEFIQQGHDAQDIQALFIRNNRILEVSFQSFRQPQEGYAISWSEEYAEVTSTEPDKSRAT